VFATLRSPDLIIDGSSALFLSGDDQFITILRLFFFFFIFFFHAALNDAILLVTQELKVVRSFVSGIHFVLPFLFWIHLTWNRGPSSPVVETDAGTCMILLLFQAPFQKGLEPI
jgi:hypothetical protein